MKVIVKCQCAETCKEDSCEHIKEHDVREDCIPTYSSCNNNKVACLVIHINLEDDPYERKGAIDE